MLNHTYSEQLENKPYEKSKISTKLSSEQSRLRHSSLKESNKSLQNVIRLEKRNMYNELRDMRKQIYSIPKENREVAKGVLVYKKLTTLERLNDLSAQGRDFISQYHKEWNEDKDHMKAIDKLKEYLNHEDENSISQAEKDISLTKAVEAQRRLQELQKTNSRLKDLVMDKRDDKIIYRDQKTENPVFTDKGDFIVSGKSQSKEEIAVMLEYSQEKFGGVLKLTGSDEFKKQCEQVAAEKDMNLILRPEQYQKIMLEAKNELAANREQQPVKDTEQPVNQAYTEQATYVYFVKFNNSQLDAEPTGFAHLKHAADWREVNANLHDVKKQDAVIYRVDEKIADQKGLHEAMNDAERVPRHDVEKVQGRDISEQDGQILDAIDRYQVKSQSEGIEFNREEVEGELLNRDLTLNVAEERLERQYSVGKAEKEQNQEQER